MADELTPMEALRLLIDRAAGDDDTRVLLAAAASRAGCASVAEFARENPDQIVGLAEALAVMDEDEEIGMAKIDEIRKATQT